MIKFKKKVEKEKKEAKEKVVKADEVKEESEELQTTFNEDSLKELLDESTEVENVYEEN